MDKYLSNPPKIGKITVAKYYPGKDTPLTPGFRNILIHTSGKHLGAQLSPYILKNEQGHILENIWQFSKIYEKVDEQKIPISRYNPDRIIWQHPAEVHIFDHEPTNEYWNWRRKGFENWYAVRYPAGFKNRHKCICAIDNQGENLDYITARKRIYCYEYSRLAPKTEDFKKLRKLVLSGKNIQILEVDGPDPNLNYYPYDQISVENPGLEMNEEVIKTLLNDTRKPFGHGYTIAALLLDHPEWLR